MTTLGPIRPHIESSVEVKVSLTQADVDNAIAASCAALIGERASSILARFDIDAIAARGAERALEGKMVSRLEKFLESHTERLLGQHFRKSELEFLVRKTIENVVREIVRGELVRDEQLMREIARDLLKAERRNKEVA